MSKVITAISVPFNADGSLNKEDLRKVIRHNIDTMKVDGMYISGSSGENFLINTNMKKEIFETVASENNNQTEIIAQVGSLDFYEACDLAKFTKGLGYNTISAVTPFYYKFSFDEIKKYYFDLIEASDQDLLIYVIPGLTGVHFSTEQFNQLLSHEKITGVKYTDINLYNLERLMKNFPNKKFYFGSDESLLSAAVLGVEGSIGSTFCITGLHAKYTFEQLKLGNIKQAKDSQSKMNDIIETLLECGLFQSIKTVFKEAGIIDNAYCRKPFNQSLPTEHAEKIKNLSNMLTANNWFIS